MTKGFGCFTYIGLMVGAAFLGFVYQSFTQQPEDFSFLFYLAIPLAIVAILINQRLEERFKERKAEEEAIQSEERRKDLEHRNWLWRVDREEALRQAREREEERTTKVCLECRMKIPRDARICPYCRTRFR